MPQRNHCLYPSLTKTFTGKTQMLKRKVKAKKKKKKIGPKDCFMWIDISGTLLSNFSPVSQNFPKLLVTQDLLLSWNSLQPALSSEGLCACLLLPIPRKICWMLGIEIFTTPGLFCSTDALISTLLPPADKDVPLFPGEEC